jgi:predicted Ser/Thr protein kinase
MAGDEEREPSPSEEFLRAVAEAGPVEPPSSLVGRSLGRYRVTSELGRGGMGVVYRARDSLLHRDVALKVLPAHLTSDESRRRRLLREARLAAATVHPSLVAVYDVAEEEGRIHVAMELVEGRSLRTVLADGALPAAEVTRIGAAIAAAIARAHEVGIIHRDVKPENIMITAGGVPKLLDFGIAKIHQTLLVSGSELTETALLTREGAFVGTPAYVSPEQAKGGAVTDKSDVFSLGIVLYEMATGRRPFAGETTVEILIAIDRDEPRSPRAIDPAIPAELEAVIAWCLRKLPAVRPCARDLATALAAPPVPVAVTGTRLEATAVAQPRTNAPAVDPRAVDLYVRARRDLRANWHTMDLDKPLELLEQALALAPNEPSFLATYAGACARVSLIRPALLPRALTLSAAAVEVAPQLGDAWLARAVALSHSNQYVDEARALVDGIAAAPGTAQLHWRAGQLLLQTGPLAAAVASLERAHGLDPHDGEVIAALARAAMLRGDAARCDAYMRLPCDSGKLGIEVQRIRLGLWRRDASMARAAVVEGGGPAAAFAQLLREGVIGGRAPDGYVAALDGFGRSRAFPYGWQLLVEMRAGAGDERGALDALAMAVDSGLIDVVNLDTLSLFDELRGSHGWSELRAVVASRADTVRAAFGPIAAAD